ncbi:MAG TPA: hypothetical protein VJK07_04555 [Candidatus Nanoarchaeia archaeon]|nr:hypothetical protein [Candidatus Nanoarchaeia archaeon]
MAKKPYKDQERLYKHALTVRVPDKVYDGLRSVSKRNSSNTLVIQTQRLCGRH